MSEELIELVEGKVTVRACTYQFGGCVTATFDSLRATVRCVRAYERTSTRNAYPLQMTHASLLLRRRSPHRTFHLLGLSPGATVAKVCSHLTTSSQIRSIERIHDAIRLTGCEYQAACVRRQKSDLLIFPFLYT